MAATPGRLETPLELLESLTVELKWRDIPFDRFRLEDGRQHVVEQSKDVDQYRAVVRGDVQLHFVAFSLPFPLDPKAILIPRRRY